MKNKGFYTGKLEETEKNNFEIAIFDLKERKRYIFFLRIDYLNDRYAIGYKKEVS